MLSVNTPYKPATLPKPSLTPLAIPTKKHPSPFPNLHLHTLSPKNFRQRWKIFDGRSEMPDVR